MWIIDDPDIAIQAASHFRPALKFWRGSTLGQVNRNSSRQFRAWLLRHDKAFVEGIFGWEDNLKMRREAADWFDTEQRSGANEINELKLAVLKKLHTRIGPTLADQIEGYFLFQAAIGLEMVDQLYELSTMVAAGYVDVLRLGEGVLVERSAAGLGKDGLRLLSILPTAAIATRLRTGMASARLRIMAQVPNQVGGYECSTNAAVRALALVAAKFFAPVTDLWHAARIQTLYHPTKVGAYLDEAVLALRRLKVRVKGPSAAGIQDVIGAAERNPDSAILFVSESKKTTGHTMMASKISGNVVIYDTYGQVYTNWQQLLAHHPDIKTSEMAIVRGSTLMTTLRAGETGGLNALGIAVKNVPLLPEILIETASRYVDVVALAGPSPAARTPVPERPADGPKPLDNGVGKSSGNAERDLSRLYGGR